MHIQRMTIVIAAVAGMLATFLPWVSFGLGSIAGTAGPDGWLNLGAFAICLIAALLGDRRRPLHLGLLCASLVPCVLATAAGISKLGPFHKKLVASELVHIGPGIYLIVLAGAVAVISACALAPQRRAVGGAMLLLSVAGLVAGLLTFHWWRFGDQGGVGLIGFQNCLGLGGVPLEECTHSSFLDIMRKGDATQQAKLWFKSNPLWYTSALLGSLLCVVAAIANILSGIDAVAGKPPC